MNDISELEARISTALDRLGAGLAQLSAGHTDPDGGRGDAGAAEALREQLDAERTANAQLEERVLAIKDKQEKVVVTLESEVTRLQSEIDEARAAMEQMRLVNARLRRNNRALREANSQGVGDPALINDSVVAELDAVNQRREADRAELDAILGELSPLFEGGEYARN